MQQTRHPGSFQGYKHCPTTTNGTQGQAPQTSQEWIHLQVQMPPHKLYRTIHRGIRKNSWGQIQGTPQGTLTHTPTHIHIRTPSQAQNVFP